MDRYEESIFGDLAVDEAEDSYDEYEEADEAEEAWDEGEEMDAAEEADEAEEEFESPLAWDEGEETIAGDESEEDVFESIVAQALGAEDTDEFFGKIFNAIKKAAPTIGKIARAVGPVASLIPGVGTAVGGVANVIGELMADEASEDEALDAFAEVAVRNKAARPVVAGLVARKVLGPKAAQMPLPMRKAAVHTINRAAKHLVATGGPSAIRALPRLARSVRRTAVARHTPPSARARVLANAAKRVAQRHPQLRRQLTKPSRLGQTTLRRMGAGGGRSRRGWPRRGWGWGGGSPGRGTYGGWGASPTYGPWGGYTDYPTDGDVDGRTGDYRGNGDYRGAGDNRGTGDYRRIRTRGPVTISIRPR
jgi:hypothetical protein